MKNRMQPRTRLREGGASGSKPAHIAFPISPFLQSPRRNKRLSAEAA